MATIAGYYFCVCTNGVENLGGDPERLVRKAGLDPARITQPLWRGSVQAMAKLVRLIWDELDNEAMGFTPQPMPRGSFAFATELALGGNHVADGLKRAIRFYNLVNRSIHTQLDETEQGVVLTVKFSSPEMDADHYFSEFWMITWHRLGCWLAGENLSIVSADFDYSRPGEYLEEFKYLFPCDHNFDADGRRLIFDRHILYAPIRRTAAELQAMVAQAPLDIMTIPASDKSMHRQVRQVLIRTPSLSTDNIARELGLQPQRMRQQLKSEGQKISRIREFVRRDTAIHWLLSSNISVESIAEDLGYAEARSFTRAFRTWTGLSPSEYRKVRN